jgi:hypothetical protein
VVSQAATSTLISLLLSCASRHLLAMLSRAIIWPRAGSVIIHDDDGDPGDGTERCASGRVVDDNVEEFG